MKKVALVGMAETTRDLAPWDDPEIEIWTLNESPAKRFGYVKRVTRHFQLHPKWNYDRAGNQNDPEHPDWLRAQKGFPIYMQDVDQDIPASVKYPLDEILAKYGVDQEKDHWREFTSTFPYMLALALYEGFDWIGVYGFEMGSETEYAFQRSSAHLWLGIARGFQLATGKPEIYIPPNARLLGWGSALYGYDLTLNLNPMEVEIDRNKFLKDETEILGKISELQGRQEQITAGIHAINERYGKEINALQQKKTDPKLRERRIQQKMDEMNAAVRPLRMSLTQIDDEKLDLSQRVNYIKGMREYCDLALSRYREQLVRITGPDKRVRLRGV